MLDEDYLPQCHPLRKYLNDLKLNDTDFQSTPKHAAFSLLGTSFPSIPWKRFVTLSDFASHLISYVFCFAEYFRLRLFSTVLTTLPHADEEYAICRQFYSSHASGYTFKPILLVSFIYFMSFVGLNICAFGVLWTLSFIGFMIESVSLFNALCIFSIDCIIRYLVKMYSETQTFRRSCITFIQEFEFHSTFGSSSSEIRAPLRLQRGVAECLRTCAFEFADLSYAFTDFPVAEEFEVGLSMTQLDSLKASLTADSVNDVLSSNHRKMFREVALMLESDLFDKVTGVIFSIRADCLRKWLRVAWLLCQCVLVVRSLRCRFYRLNQLRIALEHGIDASDKNGTSGMLSHSHICSNSAANNPARNLLMHLLVSVSDVRELINIYEQSAVSSNLDALTVIKRIRLQLDACSTFCDVLEHFLSPTSLDAQTACDLAENNLEIHPSHCLSNQSSEPITLQPVDPEPEDDVLEDVAIGIDSEDAANESAYIQTDFGSQSTLPLHSSVLRELRLAIACRRAEMEDREHKAWEKRLKSKLTGICHPASSSPQQMLETPTRSEPTASTGLSASTPIAVVPNCSSTSNQDNNLCDFFPSAVTQPHPKLARLQRTLRTQCPWRVQSAVRKRMSRFPYSMPTHSVSGAQVVNSGDIGLSKSPSMIPRDRPVVDPSFAAALLSQRRKVGYAEEDLFVDFGEREDSPQSEHTLKRRNVISPVHDADA